MLTEPVKQAIVNRRFELEEALDPRKVIAEVLDNLGLTDALVKAEPFDGKPSANMTAAVNDLSTLLSKARELGALDQVCAENNIATEVTN